MANFMIGWPNYGVETDNFLVTLTSDTTWLDTLPLDNIKTNFMHEVGATETGSFNIYFSFSDPREVDIVSIENHSLGPSDTIAISAGTTLGGTDIYSTSPLNAIPSLHRGPASTSSIEETLSTYAKNFTHITTSTITSSYWTITISSSSTYVSLGRCSFWKGWSPSHNFNRGVKLGWESDSAIETSYTGVEYPRSLTPYRIAKFNLDYIDGSEAMLEVFDLLNYVNRDRELYFIFDTDDSIDNLFRRSFPAKMATLTPLSYGYLEYVSTSFSLKEVK